MKPAIIAGGTILLTWVYDTYYPQAVEDVENLDSYGSSRLSLPLYGSLASLGTIPESSYAVKIHHIITEKTYLYKP